MTKIRDLLAAGPTISFEFFPPRTPAAEASLGQALDDLAGLKPSFVSITYGAGGTTRTNTRDLVVDICQHRPFPAMAHLTCVGHRRADIDDLLDDYRGHGVENILALAGDPPIDGSDPGGDFHYAIELVQACHDHDGFSVGVAAFPEVHPRSTSREDDRRHLAAKLEAADFAITQFFFDVDDYRRLVDELDELGVRKPVLPGVIPVTNPVSVKRFAAMNGTRVPADLWARLEAADDPEVRLDIAVDAATSFSQALLDAGAPGLHFYTLNQAPATTQVLAGLGLTP